MVINHRHKTCQEGFEQFYNTLCRLAYKEQFLLHYCSYICIANKEGERYNKWTRTIKIQSVDNDPRSLHTHSHAS